jgi:hypothetical protein
MPSRCSGVLQAYPRRIAEGGSGRLGAMRGTGLCVNIEHLTTETCIT